MKSSSLKHVAPRAVERYTQSANTNVFNAIGSTSPSNPNFYATGAQGGTTGQTFVINVTNANTLAAEEAVLFGFAKYANVARFGSGSNITITMGTSNITYSQMLYQTATSPFEVALTRVETSNQIQLGESIQFNYQDGTGRTFADPLVISSYKSPMQNQNNIIDFSSAYQINSSTWLSFRVQPETSVKLTLFASAIVNIANPINGQSAITEASQIPVNTFGKN